MSCLLVATLLSGCMSTPGKQALRPYGQQVAQRSDNLRKIHSIEDVKSIGDNDFDLAQAVLVATRYLKPDTDIERYRSYVDDMSAELAYHLKGKNPQDIPDTICDFLWYKNYICEEPYWKKYRLNDYYEMWNLDYSDFVNLLVTGKGNCMSFSILYLVMAERIGVPLYGSVVPTHIFVRYDDGAYRRNIEPTNNGYQVTDKEYIDELESEFDELTPIDTSFKEDFARYYLTNLTKKQVLGCFLMNLGKTQVHAGNVDTGLYLLKLANICNPKDPSILHNLGNVLARTGQADVAIDAFRRQVYATPFKATAYYNIGFTAKNMGNAREAAELFDMALKAKPYTFAEYWSITMAYFELGEYNEALRRFNRILLYDGSHCRSWYFKAAIFARTGNPDQALDCLANAIRANKISKEWAVQDDNFASLRGSEEFKRLLR